MISNYIVNSKTKEYHYVHSVQTTTQLMLPLKKRMEIIRTMDMPKKTNSTETNMTNFGILMEVQGIEEPFKWSRDLVSKVNKEGTGLYYSPSRRPSTTSEGETVSAVSINGPQMDEVREAFQGYYKYIDDFIDDMKKVFPTLQNDWGVYVPEVKYLSPEPLVDYDTLALIDYNNVHFVGDALSARGITVSGAQGNYVAEWVLQCMEDEEYIEHGDIVNW